MSEHIALHVEFRRVRGSRARTARISIYAKEILLDVHVCFVSTPSIDVRFLLMLQ